MKLLTTIERNLNKVKPPFFDGLSIWDILSFFVRGIYQGAITSRAGSVSFSFFLALFPGIIFIFTLIAYLPLDVFQEELFGVLKDVLPASTHEMAIDAIEDVLTIKRGGLLSVTFIAALIFATNGTLSLISNWVLVTIISMLKISGRNTFLLFTHHRPHSINHYRHSSIDFTQGFTGWLVDLGYLAEYASFVIYWARLLVLLLTIVLSHLFSV